MSKGTQLLRYLSCVFYGAAFMAITRDWKASHADTVVALMIVVFAFVLNLRMWLR